MVTTVTNADELKNAVERASPGEEIVASGGTYNMNGRWNIDNGGEAGDRIVIRAANGEKPHIQFAAGNENPTNDSGIKVNSPYVTVSRFEISDSGFKGIFAGSNGHDVTFEDLDVHHCNVWGIMNNGNDNVTFRNCDSHDNMDPQNEGQHSDGINMTGPAKNGLIEGCRAWNNGDDGYDLWVSEDHTVRYCWSWNNGQGAQGNGNGFKLGASRDGRGGGHLVHNCVSFGNKVDNTSNSPGSGFWWNGEDDKTIEVSNCTAWDNGVNFAFADAAHVLKNNISYEGPVDVSGPVVEEANSWNLGISDPQFRSMDLSSDNFLRLSESSPCRDAGAEVGLDYVADAPDLGAFEYDDGGSTGDSSTGTVTVDGETAIPAGAASTDQASLLNSRHNGYNGSGYINFDPESGSYARWSLDVAAADTYHFAIRYANGDSSDRTANLSAGDTKQQITFARTGGWDQWSTLTGTIDLPSGGADLAIETTGEDAGNVDQIVVTPQNDGSGAESDPETERAEPTGDTPNHGYAMPDAGATDWHVPLNENFASIDRDIPVADLDGVKDQYTPAERAVYIALDTGTVYVGDGSQWTELGTLN